MLFSFWSSSTHSLCSFNSQIVPVQKISLSLSRIFKQPHFISLFDNWLFTWREICSWTRLCDIFPFLKINPLVNKSCDFVHDNTNCLETEDPPGTQILQWPVSPPWSWSSWMGRSPPIHRHTCMLTVEKIQMHADIDFFAQNSKCKRRIRLGRKERECMEVMEMK